MLILRNAEEQDLMTYFKWANDKDVRNNALNKEPIPLESHKKWFESRVKDQKEHLLYVLVDNNIPVAQVRFDLEQDTLLVDYSVDANSRGKGLGTIVLQKAMDAAIKSDIVFFRFNAFVKDGNIGSARVFEKLGYTHTKDELIQEESYKFYEKRVK